MIGLIITAEEPLHISPAFGDDGTVRGSYVELHLTRPTIEAGVVLTLGYSGEVRNDILCERGGARADGEGRPLNVQSKDGRGVETPLLGRRVRPTAVRAFSRAISRMLGHPPMCS
eukprot:GHVN01036644.1.p3 GENE.GHVN01036644.1~~GHVN01036644.1.p3  ORF type:complete len:115 (+),score=16.81 GHVN01036644.1:1578-1922(+)